MAYLSFYKNFENHTLIEIFPKWSTEGASSDQAKLSASRMKFFENLYSLTNMDNRLDNICTSNESWNQFKLIFGIEKYCFIKRICKNSFFQIFDRVFMRKKFFKHKIFQFCLHNHKKFYFPLVVNTKQIKYIIFCLNKVHFLRLKRTYHFGPKNRCMYLFFLSTLRPCALCNFVIYVSHSFFRIKGYGFSQGYV